MMHTRHMLGVMALTALLPDTPTAAPGELETVIVTATGRPQSGALISAGWSRIEEESLRRTAHTHLNEAVNQVPGTWISRGNGQEHLTAIRSPVLTGAGGCGSFYMAQDGISLRAPGFCNVNQLFDATSELAQAVEVIRGPGTVRYGSNAMHGVINVVSRDVAENGRGSLRLESGPHDYLRLRFDHSWSGHNQGLRLGASGTSDGGYKDASGFDQQKLNLVHRFTDSTYSLKTVVAASNLNQETAGFVSGKDAYKVDDLKKFNPNPEAFRDAQSWRLHSDINIPLDNGAELHLTPYLRGNEMRFVQHFLPWKAIEENDQHSLGMRLATYRETTDGSWNLGLDAEATQGSLEEFQPTEFRAAQPQGLHYDYEVDATLAAIYAERRHWLHPQWQADVGVRYEYNGYDYDTLVTPGSPCDPGVSCRFFRPVDRRDSFADWSLNASIAYDYHADHRVYLRAAQGFRAPQATELYRLQQGQSRARLDSEELDSLELGLRGSWSRVEYDVQAWLMKKSNVIFQIGRAHV